jgi:hypothetical protein
MLRSIEASASAFKVQVTAAGARNAAELENAIDQFAREPNGGLIVLPNPVTLLNQRLIVELATRHRLPAACSYRYIVAEGGLISYGSICSTSTGRPPPTSIVSCGARSPPTSQFSSRPSSISSSTSKALRRLASLCRIKCSPPPAR